MPGTPGTPAGTRAQNAATFDSAWAIVARTHWDTTYNGVNWPAVRDGLRPRAVASRNIGELRSVLQQMLSTLGQSHFAVMPGEADLSGEAGRDLSGGIGATVRESGGAFLITAVRRAGPAAGAGVQPGFALETIDGCRMPPPKATRAGVRTQQTALQRWSAVMTRLRGPVGDSVHLVVRNASGKRQSFTLVRDADPGVVTTVGNLPAISAELETSVRVMNGKRIGVLRFNVWMPMLMPLISAAIDSLRDADGIVLDLRGNPGGIAPMASGVAGYFVDTVLTLGTMIERGATRRYLINPQRVNSRNKRVRPYDGPLALVVDELSVSTTEIFADGLQALGRARVFGTQTAGAVLPAVAERLPNGDVLYHAVANFLSPDGRPLEGRGVVPDVAIPVTRAALLRGEDPALDAALRWAASTDVHGFVIRKW